MFRESNGNAMINDNNLTQWSKPCFPTKEDAKSSDYSRETFRYAHAWASLVLRLCKEWITYRAGHTERSQIDAKTYGQNTPDGESPAPANFNYTPLDDNERSMYSYSLTKVPEGVANKPCNNAILWEHFANSECQKIIEKELDTAEKELAFAKDLEKFIASVTEPSQEGYTYLCKELGMDSDVFGAIEIPLLTLDGLDGACDMEATSVLASANKIVSCTPLKFTGIETTLPENWAPYQLTTLAPLYYLNVSQYMDHKAPSYPTFTNIKNTSAKTDKPKPPSPKPSPSSSIPLPVVASATTSPSPPAGKKRKAMDSAPESSSKKTAVVADEAPVAAEPSKYVLLEITKSKGDNGARVYLATYQGCDGPFWVTREQIVDDGASHLLEAYEAELEQKKAAEEAKRVAAEAERAAEEAKRAAEKNAMEAGRAARLAKRSPASN